MNDRAPRTRRPRRARRGVLTVVAVAGALGAAGCSTHHTEASDLCAALKTKQGEVVVSGRGATALAKIGFEPDALAAAEKCKAK
jgi:hypothetical protein